MSGALGGIAAKVLGRGGTITRRLRLRRVAESLYGMALKFDNRHVGAAYGCGRLRERRRDWSAAVAAYSVPINEGAADVAPLLVRRGTASRRLGHFDEAVADLLAAEHPQPAPFVRLAKRCREHGRLPTAVVALEQVRRLAPADTGSLRLLAETYRDLGEWDAACGAYRDVIADGEPDAELRCGFAKAIRRQALVPFELRGSEPIAPLPGSIETRYGEAVSQLELAAFTSQRRVRTAFLLGRFYEEQGRFAEAARMFRLALSRLADVDAPWTRRARAEWEFRLARVVRTLNPADAADPRLSRTVIPGVPAATVSPPSGYVEASVGHRGLEIDGFVLPGQQGPVEFHVDGRFVASVAVDPASHLPGFRFRLTHALLEFLPRQARLSAKTSSGILGVTGGSRYLVVNVPDGTGKLSVLLDEGHTVDDSGRLSVA